VGFGKGFVEVDVSELESAGEAGVGLDFSVVEDLIVVAFLDEGGGFEFNLILFDVFALTVVQDVEGFSFVGSVEVLDVFVGECFVKSVLNGLLEVLILVGVANTHQVHLLRGRVFEVEHNASAGIRESL